MENAADALKMAFAVFVFIMALSLLFFQISKVKETADHILFYSDKTTYYEWDKGNLQNGRKVGVDTVISTLHNQTKELTYVIIEMENDTKEFGPTSNLDSKNEFINTKLLGKQDMYLETINEITTDGIFRTAEDGTRITIKPGVTRTYVTYKKIN